MKTLYINGEELQAEKIIRTSTDIIGYNNDSDMPVWSFRGISDFTQFTLADDQTFDIDPEAEKEQRIADLEAAIAAIMGGGV